MSILLIFGFGVFVGLLFIVGIFYSNEEKNEVNIDKIETDITDYDGGGNYGRIPDKKTEKQSNLSIKKTNYAYQTDSSLLFDYFSNKTLIPLKHFSNSFLTWV